MRDAKSSSIIEGLFFLPADGSGNALLEFYEQAGTVMRDLKGSIELMDYLSYVGLEQEAQELFPSLSGQLSIQTVLLRRRQQKLKETLEEAKRQAEEMMHFASRLEKSRRDLGVYERRESGV